MGGLLTSFGPTIKDFGPTQAQAKNPDVMARYLTCVANSAQALSRPAMGLLLMIGPDQAQEIAKAGYTKEDVKRWLYEHTAAPWGKVKRQPWLGFTMFEPAESLTIQGKSCPCIRRRSTPRICLTTPWSSTLPGRERSLSSLGRAPHSPKPARSS